MLEHDSERDPRRTRLRRVRWALPAIAVLCAAAVAGFTASRRSHREGAGAEFFAYQPSATGELPKLWELPAFSFTDHRQAVVSRESLRGEPFIADFIFTQCTNACPILTSRMVQLQRRLAGQDVRFVSFSVDPAHDDLPTLASYAQRWNSSESRWSLLATDEKRLEDIVGAFRVTAAKTEDTANPIIHSNVFFLVDAASNVRGVYASDDSAALDRLVRDASKMVAGNSTTRSGSDGPRTYASLGCAGCHENTAVAPPLVNLGAGERMLETGERVTVDRAYLRRAILEPGSDLVKGYLPLMPSYRDELDDKQVEALVDELLARRGQANRPAEVAQIVIDPVCHMRVRAEPTALQATHAGHTTYFCSESCRDAFVAAPDRYAPAEPR